MKQTRADAATALIEGALRCTCGTYGHQHAKRCPLYSPPQASRSGGMAPADTKNRRTHGSVTAYRAEAAGHESWWVISKDGKQVGTVPDEQFQRDGAELMAAYDLGQSYMPPALPGQATLPRELQLQHGRDATLAVDEWTREQAAAEYDEGGRYTQAVGARDVEQWPAFEREMFASLFGDPTELPEEERAAGADWMRQVLDQARSLPEWDTLRGQARSDAWASGLAAARLTDALSGALDEALKKLPAEDPQRLEEEAEALADIAGTREDERVQAAELKAAQAAAQAELVAEGLSNGKGEHGLRLALREAIEEASAEISEVNEGIAVIGGAPGTLGACQAPRGEIRRTLEANPKLRSIANVAGRLKLAARQKQRTKTRYVPEQVVDVELGAEIRRLLPSEVLLLAAEETELVLYRKLLERNAQQYRLDGTEQRARGPVVLCVDGSGSMQGLRHEWAMGVALALLELCVTQKRGFALVHFDASVRKTFVVPKPAQLKLSRLLDMVLYFPGGGTRFAPPLQESVGYIEREGLREADVILLTDGANESGEGLEQVKALKALGAATYGVAIGGGFQPDMRAELAGVASIDARMSDTAEIDLVFGI